MLRFGCLLVLVLVICTPVLLGHYLPWYGTLGVIVAECLLLVLLVPKLLGWGVKRFAMGLFTTKSRVLRDPDIRIHSVELAPAPTRRTRRPSTIPSADGEAPGTVTIEDAVSTDGEAEGEDDEAFSGRYVRVDFTLTPKPGQSKMSHWEPSELLLVPFDAKVSMSEDPTDDDAASASAQTVRLVTEDGGETEEFDKLPPGPSRLRVTFAVPDTLRGRAKFRYYFESFGDLRLP